MLKKLISLFFVLFFFLFISNKISSPVQGQTPTPPIQAPAGQVWRCLKAEQVGGRSPHRPPPQLDLTLSGGGFPSLQDIYVVICIPPVTGGSKAPKSYKCTTGNSQYDQLLFGSDLSSTILPTSIQVPKGTDPPGTVQAAGDRVETVIHMSGVEGHVNYAFFGVSSGEAMVLPGQGSTIQYGTLQFTSDPGGCLSIRWDPYGRVFDSQSLEPIPNVRVNLLNDAKQFAVMKGLINPQRTEADGIYNFFVNLEGTDPATFYLNPIPPATYTFTATPNIHPNYVKAYSDLYTPDQAIVESPGKPEHRDIPLDPGSNPPFRSTPVDMTIDMIRLGNWTRYEGTVSHPLSIVALVTVNSHQEVARTTADKNGDWQILLSNSQVPQNEPVETQIQKVDLTALTLKPSDNFFAWLKKSVLRLFTSEVSAQQESSTGGGTQFQPILAYVDGYAKDKNGNVIPNAVVKVKLSMSDGVYYQTTADENGYFTVPPERLPVLEYYLEFSRPNNGGVLVKYATAEFAQNNETYLNDNKINLMTASRNGESLIPTQPVSPPPQVSPTVQASPAIFAGNSFSLVMTVIVLVVLLSVAGGVLIYMKKKKSESSDLL